MLNFDQLPVELAQPIMRIAAEDSLYLDRSWLVGLATVSRAVYWVVHPVLYRVMVITDSNATAISELAQDPLNHHIFGAVRRLHILRRLDATDLPAPGLFTASGIHIDAHIDVIESFIALLGSRISSVRAVNTCIQTDRFPPITHLAIDVRTKFTILANDWVCKLLAPLPSVTHVAFEFIDDSFIDATQILHYQVLVFAVLDHPQIVQFAVRFSGGWCEHWKKQSPYAYSWDDPRFVVWLDDRPMDRRLFQDRHFQCDAWEGRDAWTEAKQFRDALKSHRARAQTSREPTLQTAEHARPATD